MSTSRGRFTIRAEPCGHRTPRMVRRPGIIRWLWHRQHRLYCSANVEYRENRQRARALRDQAQRSGSTTSRVDVTRPEVTISDAPPTPPEPIVQRNPDFTQRTSSDRHVFQTSISARRTETPFERVASVLAAGLLLGDGLWIAIVTADRDSGLDLVVGLFTGIVLTLVGAMWLLYIIGRRQ